MAVKGDTPKSLSRKKIEKQKVLQLSATYLIRGILENVFKCSGSDLRDSRRLPANASTRQIRRVSTLAMPVEKFKETFLRYNYIRVNLLQLGIELNYLCRTRLILNRSEENWELNPFPCKLPS